MLVLGHAQSQVTLSQKLYFKEEVKQQCCEIRFNVGEIRKLRVCNSISNFAHFHFGNIRTLT